MPFISLTDKDLEISPKISLLEHTVFTKAIERIVKASFQEK